MPPLLEVHEQSASWRCASSSAPGAYVVPEATMRSKSARVSSASALSSTAVTKPTWCST